ncbi:FHA domain-containing protein [Buchananella hordeovulneris]|uniref:FHA domain-containing protein n=1 Tax=Buchananella hordeovulneris TaxID=52770 RepID=UPI000F5E6984|nr:FHA domain-containing protein [Buchananella hordeovulneris]RRD52407.1 FHA domain-containing protein [Buchananella hordeovulneris]
MTGRLPTGKAVGAVLLDLLAVALPLAVAYGWRQTQVVVATCLVATSLVAAIGTWMLLANSRTLGLAVLGGTVVRRDGGMAGFGAALATAWSAGALGETVGAYLRDTRVAGPAGSSPSWAAGTAVAFSGPTSDDGPVKFASQQAGSPVVGGTPTLESRLGCEELRQEPPDESERPPSTAATKLLDLGASSMNNPWQQNAGQTPLPDGAGAQWPQGGQWPPVAPGAAPAPGAWPAQGAPGPLPAQAAAPWPGPAVPPAASEDSGKKSFFGKLRKGAARVSQAQEAFGKVQDAFGSVEAAGEDWQAAVSDVAGAGQAIGEAFESRPSGHTADLQTFFADPDSGPLPVPDGSGRPQFGYPGQGQPYTPPSNTQPFVPAHPIAAMPAPPAEPPSGVNPPPPQRPGPPSAPGASPFAPPGSPIPAAFPANGSFTPAASPIAPAVHADSDSLPLPPGGGPTPEGQLAPSAPGQEGKRLVLTMPAGQQIVVDGMVIIGRRPSPPAGLSPKHLVAIPDETRTLSKQHVVLNWDGGVIHVRDLGSTNGTTVQTTYGVYKVDAAGPGMDVEPGTVIWLGNHRIGTSLES